MSGLIVDHKNIIPINFAIKLQFYINYFLYSSFCLTLGITIDLKVGYKIISIMILDGIKNWYKIKYYNRLGNGIIHSVGS